MQNHPPETGASNDVLSSLLDRENFYMQSDRIASYLPEGTLAILFMHVTNIKGYNTRRGIAAGDVILRRVVRRIVMAFPQGLAARHAADCFLVLGATAEVEKFAKRINHNLSNEMHSDAIVVKIGYCTNSPDYQAREAALRAEFACESIVNDPDVLCCRFEGEVANNYARRAYVIDHLENAVENGEIVDYYQPIVRVLTGQVCEVEVLARWQNESFGVMLPGEFINLLEEQRLIHKIDICVTRLACKHWREAYDADHRAVPFGINLSRLDFELCDIFAEVTRAMKEYGVPLDACHIEITESALSSDTDLLWEGVKRFRDAGFSIYMDDFGSGYSSLKVLDDFDFDVVKLDMTLIAEVETNERARVVVSDAVNMIKRLNMQTLCEGVETEEQLAFLRTVGCEKAQGFLFGKPMSRDNLMRLLVGENDFEQDADSAYLNTIGQINMSDGSQANVQGIESVSFLGREPIAVIELLGPRIRLINSNSAFNRFLGDVGVSDFEAMLDQVNGKSGEMRDKISYAASQTKETGREASLDFIVNGSYCSFALTHVASNGERDAYLVRTLDVSRHTPLLQTSSLERSLRHLYTTYKRLDLFDLEDGSFQNLYINSPVYSGREVEGRAIDAITDFCELRIHPDDREEFLAFYDLGTVEQRVAASPYDYISCAIRTLSDESRYTDQIFQLIPMVQNGRRQVLSTLRARSEVSWHGKYASKDPRISDQVLLTGVLEVCDRQIFWKDDQRRFLGANQAFLDYYGFKSINDILGKTDEDMGWHQSPEPFRTDELAVLDGERTHHARGTCLARGEVRQIEASKRPLYREGKVVGLVGYFRDVTGEPMPD